MPLSPQHTDCPQGPWRVVRRAHGMLPLEVVLGTYLRSLLVADPGFAPTSSVLAPSLPVRLMIPALTGIRVSLTF